MLVGTMLRWETSESHSLRLSELNLAGQFHNRFISVFLCLTSFVIAVPWASTKEKIHPYLCLRSWPFFVPFPALVQKRLAFNTIRSFYSSYSNLGRTNSHIKPSISRNMSIAFSFDDLEDHGINHHGRRNMSRIPDLNVSVHPLWRRKNFRLGVVFDEIDYLSVFGEVGWDDPQRKRPR